jgi:hypothetical protein
MNLRFELADQISDLRSLYKIDTVFGALSGIFLEASVDKGIAFLENTSWRIYLS